MTFRIFNLHVCALSMIHYMIHAGKHRKPHGFSNIFWILQANIALEGLSTPDPELDGRISGKSHIQAHT